MKRAGPIGDKKRLLVADIKDASDSLIRVTMNADLSLDCGCGQMPWCDHRTKALQSGGDANLVPALIKLWEEADIPQFGDDVLVPLTPTHGIFNPVRLDSNGRGRIVVTLPPPKIRAGELDTESLGVIAEGDGLWAIRSMVSDAIMPMVSSSKYQCTNKRHGYKAEAAIHRTKKLNDKVGTFVTSWHVFMSGSCDHCNGSIDRGMESYSFDDVLVEDSILPAARRSIWKT